MAKHDQRGRDIGTCPDCGKRMYATDRTINLPIKVDGKWKGVLVHQACADQDR